MSARIGTAGWAIPKLHAASFVSEGAGLVRYSHVFECAEINSTFYRSHRLSTYERWAASVPANFQFSVKAPRAITHECGLAPTAAQFREFLDEIGRLRPALGPILFQFPPRQAFDERSARAFFSVFREQCPDGLAAVEPRHAGWFSPEAEAIVREFRIARVAADPARVEAASVPGGDHSLVYYRLHGAPRMYYSSYPTERLKGLAEAIRHQSRSAEVWCIFDNTASGAAAGNALELMRMVASGLR